MGMLNIIRGTWIHRIHSKRALRHSFGIDWSYRPGFLWHDFDTGTVLTMQASRTTGAITRRTPPPKAAPRVGRGVRGQLLSVRVS